MNKNTFPRKRSCTKSLEERKGDNNSNSSSISAPLKERENEKGKKQLLRQSNSSLPFGPIAGEDEGRKGLNVGPALVEALRN